MKRQRALSRSSSDAPNQSGWDGRCSITTGKGRELLGGGAHRHTGSWVHKTVLLLLNFLINDVWLLSAALQCHSTRVRPYPMAQHKGPLPLPPGLYVSLQEV